MTGRSLEKVKTAKLDVERCGIKGLLSAVQLDVIDERSIGEAVKYVEGTHGRLDILINNAGIGNMDANVKARFQQCLETNTMGPAMVAAAFRPLLLKSQAPYSIFVSSGAGSMTRALKPSPHSLPNEDAYRASKAALNMIAIMEDKLYNSSGLKVFTVSPGFVVSNLRGTSEDARMGWGLWGDGDPLVAGNTLLEIIEGKRDDDAGKFVTKDGVYPW